MVFRGGNFVKGVASAGVIPSSKHFIMNEQETNRDSSGSSGGGGGSTPDGGSMGNSSSISVRQSSNSTTTDNSTTSSSSDSYGVVIDDKAFHETYLVPFYDAVKSGMAGMMCAMNKVNGTYSVNSNPLFFQVSVCFSALQIYLQSQSLAHMYPKSYLNQS